MRMCRTIIPCICIVVGLVLISCSDSENERKVVENKQPEQVKHNRVIPTVDFTQFLESQLSGFDTARQFYESHSVGYVGVHPDDVNFFPKILIQGTVLDGRIRFSFKNQPFHHLSNGRSAVFRTLSYSGGNGRQGFCIWSRSTNAAMSSELLLDVFKTMGRFDAVLGEKNLVNGVHSRAYLLIDKNDDKQYQLLAIMAGASEGSMLTLYFEEGATAQELLLRYAPDNEYDLY